MANKNTQKNKRSVASNRSKQGAQTAKARREFRDTYWCAEMVAKLAKGKTSREVSYDLDVNPRTVAAVKANLSRGNYLPYVGVGDDGTTVGTCRY